MAKKVSDPDWFARQIRVAMGRLRWRQLQLAEASGKCKETVGRALRLPPSSDPRAVETRRALIKACEARGHRFPASWRERALA